MTRVYGPSALSVCARPSSGALALVTKRKPSFLTGFQIGWRPYQAHDSTPLTSVPSTAIETLTTAGSDFAIEASRSKPLAATAADCFAGTPFRSAEAPDRHKHARCCPR